MKFHLITQAPGRGPKAHKTVGLFKDACVKLGIEFLEHDVENLALTELPILGKGDLLYRTSTTDKARLAEKVFINPDCTTFYQDWTAALNGRGSSYFLHEKLGLPVIPSVPFMPGTEVELDRVVLQLGGFPLIVKVRGGSHGVGVILVDSLVSLRSVLDYLRSTAVPVLLRKYIPHRYDSRLVVVGDKVVASQITEPGEGEFRTNVGDSARTLQTAKVFPVEVTDIAVQAVHSLGLETGGVDLIFDEDDQPFIAEMNFPNDFTYTQEVTKIDIAEAMVKHLMAKAERS